MPRPLWISPSLGTRSLARSREEDSCTFWLHVNVESPPKNREPSAPHHIEGEGSSRRQRGSRHAELRSLYLGRSFRLRKPFS